MKIVKKKCVNDINAIHKTLMGGSLWPMSEVARLEKLAGEGRKEFTPSRAYFMAFIPCSYSLK